MLKIKMSELRAALRKLRAEHSGKAVGRMTAEELSREISHHETACKAREMKEKRLAALEKARESRAAAKKVEVVEKKVMKKGKEDEKLGEEVETIKSRMVKKKTAKNE